MEINGKLQNKNQIIKPKVQPETGTAAARQVVVIVAWPGKLITTTEGINKIR